MANAQPRCTLKPVDWSAAGFAPLPDGDAEFSLSCFSCGNARNLPITSPSLSFDNGLVQFSAELVSEISGNRWTFGVQNLSITVPAGEFFDIDIEGSASAQAVAPTGPGLPDLVFIAETATFFFIESSTLGPSTGQSGRLITFFPGDDLELISFVDYSTGNDTHSETISGCGSAPGLDLSGCLVTVELFQVVAVPEPSRSLQIAAGLMLCLVGGRRRLRS